MKEIKAIVKHFKANDILSKLIDSGYPNLTVTLSEGTGNFKDSEASISTQFSVTDSKVAKIVLVCDDLEVEKIVGIISTLGRTGNQGDGIIYVTDVEKVYSVKTGLENEID